MVIWIIGGTAETSDMTARLKGRRPYVVTVATAAGKAALPADEPVIVGRLDETAMGDFLRERAIETVVDLSHPYAVEVSRNARRACQACGVRYLRYVRPQTPAAGAIRVASVAECVEFIRTLPAGVCVFFTTGSKHVAAFQAVRGARRFVYRVLPTAESVAECARQQVAMRDIVALLGPFSEAFNAAMFREYQADYVVMKASGPAGGTPAKLAACRRLGIAPIIISRPPEDGIDDLDTLIEQLTCP